MSKESADAATAADFFRLVHIHYPNYAAAKAVKEWIVDKGKGQQCVVREKAKSGIKTVTEVLLSLYNSIPLLFIAILISALFSSRS